MSMRRKSLQNTGPMLPGFEISETAEVTTSHPLTSSVEGFPANHIASQESDRQVQMIETSGESSTVSFASLGPDGCWLKTYQDYYQVRMDGSLEEYSENWPR